MQNTPAQEIAINFSGNDMLVSAAAGSGKTRTLVNKIVKNVINGGDVSRYLVVTFTNAAANELRVRLSVSLTEELSKNKGNRHLSEQLVRVGSADICTIDAFCLKLLRANFDKVGIDGDMRIGEESELAVIRNEVMEEVIDSFYEMDEPDPDFLTVCDCYGDIRNNEKLTDSLLELHKSLSSTWKGTDFLLENSSLDTDFINTPFGKIIIHHIKTLVDRCEREYPDIIAECKKDPKTVKGYLPCIENDLEYMGRIRKWLECGSYAELKENFDDLKLKDLGKVTGECESDRDLIKSVRSVFTSEIKDIKAKLLYLDVDTLKRSYELNARMCRSVHKILKIYEEKLEERKKYYSVFDFNDVERFALRILYNGDGEISDLAKEYRKKYDYVFIDEYQDTNSVQDKIFSALSCKNRFMVGDIKQSIYKFRSAEPEIFSSYRTLFHPYGSHTDKSPGVSLFMSENFRSDKGVIEFSNLVSDYTFRNTTAIDYEDKDCLVFPKKDLPEGYIHRKADVYFIRSDVEDGDEEYNPEAEFVAKKIKELIISGSLPVSEENPEGRVRPKDITILLRTRTRLESYISALKREGVGYEYLIEDEFYQKSEILFMLCILNAIDSPTRDVYLTGAMRSQVFGFTLGELVKIRKASRSAPSMYAACKAYGKENKIKEKLDFFFEKIEKYRAECRKLPAHQILTMLYADLGILGGCAISEKKNLIKLYNVARKFEGSSYKGLGAFLRYVDTASKDKIKESVGDNPGESVKIMTVHASKGLEFPICFLCDISTEYSTNRDVSKPLLFERRTGVCGKVSRNDGLVKYDTLLRKCAARAIRNANVEEEIRKLYVALTRASKKLIVTAKVKDPVSYLEKMKRIAKYPSEHAILKTRSTADLIACACATPKDCFDLTVIDGYKDMEKIASENTLNAYYTEEDVYKVKEILKKRFEYTYGNSRLNKIPSKLSVSRLTPTILDGTENEEVEQKTSIDTYPAFLSEGQIKRTGAEVGTATHLFMQFCDFDFLYKNGAKQELQRLLKEKFISESVSRLVNVKYLEAFKSSELFESLKNAKRVVREFRFNVLLDASELSATDEFDGEKALVQGVIDCIYETEDGEIVLVDYKTDSVNEENYRQVLTERHKNQLTYYKKACEMMLERKISRALLYSIPVAKCVEIKFKEE